MNVMNSVKLTALFATLVALFAGLGYLFFGPMGLIMGIVLAGGMNLLSYFYSHKIVTKMHRAKPLERADAPELHDMVERLAEKADVPVPDLYLMESATPNAFATGRNPSNAVVCVTSGLLQGLGEQEVEGVLAHEIAHVKNRDTLIQAAAGTIAGAVSMLAQMLFFSSLDGEARNPAFLIGGMLMAPVAASLLKMAISRSREYTADETAATFTEPHYLASALESIESHVQARPMQNGARGTSHMFIVNPFRGDTLSRLFSTHPPTEERVARLRSM